MTENPEDAAILSVETRRAVSEPTATDGRTRLTDALETLLCRHGRTATFAAVIRDVLEVLEFGDTEHGVPPVLMIMNPSPEQTRACRRAGIPCPAAPRIVEGMAISDGLTEAWERRVRRLIKPCEPLTGSRRRVVEAKWVERRPTTSSSNRTGRSSSGYWSLLLDCGHEVKRRVSSATRQRTPRWSPCCLCTKETTDE